MWQLWPEGTGGPGQEAGPREAGLGSAALLLLWLLGLHRLFLWPGFDLQTLQAPCAQPRNHLELLFLNALLVSLKRPQLPNLR